ncbi:hypothetical protein FIBSPDRAFT_886239 [Athelia psychrophila]|uniref:Cation efflux protein n=1 Tax=Athelia psychrophila TaxID=1759441 RepID=A0A166QXD5_9AGAM|nr:hypothetical protein FIBSPDRAFT_903050 [Fibularhizoctonia sp. CBS 109695]KZP27661.1 hypothetical protein FIBSPDRAFT_886239 [Fibularhizoctonia sp. CBS 109695]
MAARMHRRKSSINEDDPLVVDTSDYNQPTLVVSESNGHTNGDHSPTSPTRTRTASSPAPFPMSPSSPTSAGPYRTTFGVATAPPRAPNGANGHPSSPFRSTLNGHTRAHSRVGSVSGSFAPPLPSPLSGSFPSSVSHSQVRTPSHSADSLLPSSASNPETLSNGLPSTMTAQANRRHSRLHSRNLSIFFPRPGSLNAASIDEDGAQEIQVSLDEESAVDIATPRTADHQKKLHGFTFGGRPATSSASSSNHSLNMDPDVSAGGGSTSRRGHHHKHSMSHQFFSFLEPGSQQTQSLESELLTQPTPSPVSPWTSETNGHSHSHSPSSHDHGHDHDHSHSHASSPAAPVFHYSPSASNGIPPVPLVASILQFALGAYLWVTGQQIGSLSCTGLGYWVVFDAFGVGIGGGVLSAYLGLHRGPVKGNLKRAYGNARVETVVMFAQSVYLMFASVYVCKETVEHLLLSAGGEGEGHHHHHGDEEVVNLGIEFPILLVFMTMLSLISTAIFFGNHIKLVNIAGNHIPPIRSLIRDALSRHTSQSNHFHPTPDSAASKILTNPFVLWPVLFCAAIVSAAIFLPLEHYRTFDLALAGVQTVVTFNVAYHACYVLGTVLLQTAPERGHAGGKMEAFLRAMKEVERHPQVLHLPAPHIWQLTPSPNASNSEGAKNAAQELVVTMELHVRRDLGDDDVLLLTRWAWERCVNALQFGSGDKSSQGVSAEVTVGVVRG